MDKKYHKRKIGNLPTDPDKPNFELNMKNDSLFLFNKLADVMTLLVDNGPSSSLAVQRRLNDQLVRIITGDQYDAFVDAYQKTFGKKWFSYKEEQKKHHRPANKKFVNG